MGRDGGFDAYAQNVKTLPHDSTSVIIRSYFGRFGMQHPLYVPGREPQHVDGRADRFVRPRYAAGELTATRSSCSAVT